MARRESVGRFTWTMEGTTAQCFWLEKGKKREEEQEPEHEFDMSVLFENFKELNEVQRKVIFYGVKQKLADSTAIVTDVPMTKKERLGYMIETFVRLGEGTWNEKKASGDTIKVSKKKLLEVSSLVDLRAMKSLDESGLLVMPEEAKAKLLELEEAAKEAKASK